jgi:hypothetical protein
MVVARLPDPDGRLRGRHIPIRSRFLLRYVIPEGYGILEFSHFLMPLAGLFIAASLLLLPFVRARPLVFTVALIGALSCLYIAGEEMSWG